MKLNTIMVEMIISLLLLTFSVAASDHTLKIFGNANEDER